MGLVSTGHDQGSGKTGKRLDGLGEERNDVPEKMEPTSSSVRRRPSSGGCESDGKPPSHAQYSVVPMAFCTVRAHLELYLDGISLIGTFLL